VLADMIASIRPLFERYLPGFDDSSAVKQAPGLPNHLIWILGHLALYNHRAAERISGAETPLGWDPEPFSFQSSPTADRSAYPPLETALERWRESLATLETAVRALAADHQAMHRTIPWGTVQVPLPAFLARMIAHNGVHCGQLTDIRRALGLGRVLA